VEYFLSRSYPSRVKRFTRPGLRSCTMTLPHNQTPFRTGPFFSLSCSPLSRQPVFANSSSSLAVTASPWLVKDVLASGRGFYPIGHVSILVLKCYCAVLCTESCICCAEVPQTGTLGSYSGQAGGRMTETQTRGGRTCAAWLDTTLSGFLHFSFLPELLYATLLAHCITILLISSLGIVAAVFSV